VWVRGLDVADLELISQKEQDGKVYSYRVSKLPTGTVAWACTVQVGTDPKERLISRGLIPKPVLEWAQGR